MRAWLGLVLLALLGLAAPSFAQSASSYDHTATGYPLRGKHEDVRCEACHLRGIFKGTPRDCATCHAQNNTRGAVAMPNLHIQTTQACDACHSVNGFSGVLFTHIGVAPGGCASCHDNVRVRGKPAVHPATIASCDECHVTTAFLPAAVKPANHIPTRPGASCSACHRSPNFSVMPSLADIHANAPTQTSGCANCHGAAAAASFALPSANFTVVGFPADHLPTTGACETCHAGPGTGTPALPVGNGAKFSGALMSHVGISSGCDTCHQRAGGTARFAGISAIVGMPPTTPAGAGAHIPTDAPCEACHLASTPALPVPASATKTAPGTGFATPAPSSAQIHRGITSGCNACHDTGLVWMGLSAYPASPLALTPGAQYRGFQSRPTAGGGAFAVADPAHPSSGDCSQCHSSTGAFSGVDKPANHIPYSAAAQCTSCHTSGSNYQVMPSITDIHAWAPSTSTNCAQCHGAAAASFAIPANSFAIVGLPSNHIPTNASCEVCHVGPGSSIAATPVTDGAKFSGSLMNHSGISSNCNACHQPAGSATAFAGIARIVGMPATSPAGPNAHIPSSTTCETCHLASRPTGLIPASATATAPGTGFASPAPTGPMVHTGISGGCNACHEAGLVWMGMGAYPISPAVITVGAQYKGFQTRPTAAGSATSVADAAHPATGDCVQCHGSTVAFTAIDKPANHIPTAANAACNACHKSSDFAAMPSLADIHANAPSTTANCAQCHGAAAPSFAIPAHGFAVVGLPANHIPTTASCEVCHVGPGSSVSLLPVGDGAKFSGSLMNHAGINKDCATCHLPAGNGTSFAGIARLIGMPPTNPPGASSHIPSSTVCESCHIGSLPVGFMPASATKTAPGTGFATPLPTGAQIHAGVSGGCNACHEAGFVWMGVGAYPISPTSLVPGAQYKGFQTRPRAAASTFSVADPAHPLNGDCSQCHGSTVAFTAIDKPANHIPFAASAQCNSCHKSTDYTITPTLADIHANAPSTTTNCAQCHGAAAASFAIPANNFSIVGLPANHIPSSASCEVCHVGTGSSIAALPVGNGAKFAGSLMNHAGITQGCANCHVPAGSSAAFAGIARIVGMPPTSPAGTQAHIPSGTVCESCHLGSAPAGLIPASATKTAPGTGFATPAPTGAMIHAGISTGCNTCHEAGLVWMGMGAYPISPTVVTAGASYKGFQTRPRAVASTFSVADAAHPLGRDCSECHASTVAFTGVDKPANHIPYAATAQCNNCHTTNDYAVMPTLTAIHANAQSTTGNCTQCHGDAAASFAIPAVNFSIVGKPGDHLPTTQSCEVCHVGAGSSMAATPVTDGARFSGSLMSHIGISTNCVACHATDATKVAFFGVTNIVKMPPTSPPGPSSHIPSGTNCEACHLASLPPALVPANATSNPPGTGFAAPLPTGAQIHSGITGGCNACHEASMEWLGMAGYPISPTVITAGAQYRGFQTRPRAGAGNFNVADAAHPTTGDCSGCHASTTAFTGVDVPANHIPYAAGATCNACHNTANFKAPPTLTAIHANAPSTSGNCAQCHGDSAPSFAIPASNFSIVGKPANHVPTTAPCELCHVGPGSSIAALPVVDGARFSNSLMSHTGITNNCVACHQPSGATTAFAGIGRIVGMPPTTPAGAGSHIPSGTACESCHLGSLPSGLVPASATATAPGTAFASPAPTGAQIHGGITGGCNACHDTGMVWMGVGAYPISPAALTAGAQYRGFQTRPRNAAGTYNVADPAHPVVGDCSQCHASTTAFTGIDKPANHIPYATSAQCNSCHTSSDYAVMPTLANIHANAPSTSGNCTQCHGDAAASFAIPAANFSIVGKPGNHIPTSASCEVCHVGAGSSIAALPVGDGARFANSKMNHAGIGGNCVACHQPDGASTAFAGIARIVGMPPTAPAGASSHIPSGTNCETCHLASVPQGLINASATATAPGTAFATPAPSSAQIHTGLSGNCNACHEAGMVWMGVSAYPISPSVLTAGAQYRGFHTRPRTAASPYSVADAAHPAAGDCSQCHVSTSSFSGVEKPANHIPVSVGSQCSSCHTSSDYAAMPSLINIHTWAPSTTNNCAQCHGSAAASFAIPSANFSIVGLPGNHIPTTASCEVCHVGVGSSITSLPVGNGARFANSAMNHAGISSNCVACHQPSGSASSFAGITRIVGMPPTSPAGTSSHIPSGTGCESCHLASLPSGFIPASATLTAPGTGFATPAPTGAQIHSGITGGCSACHDTGMVWMGVGAYPISPSVLSPGALYTGFQTRPRAAAGAYNVADPAHPVQGDCSQCHGNTTAFTGIDKPANHIPYSAAAFCDSCHTSTDYAVMPSITNIHAWAPSTTTNCAQCHGAAAASFAIPAAGFSIVGLPGNHLPTTASCEVCHVGPGSSIATLPVTDGARFTRSLMNHAGITKDCANCHVPAGTPASFAGVTRIVGMPPTSPMGASSHIPSSTVCETCHLASMPSGSIAASATLTAPGTGFATPAPTGPQIHAGVTGGCASCHEASYVWMGMNAYPIAPRTLTAGASYTGFQTRPRAAAGTFNVADPAHPSADDCSRCHGSTTAFTGVDKPANHIPHAATAQCSHCHTGTDYSVMPTLANIHAYAPSTTTNCAQCHGSAAASFAIPAANFSIVGLPNTHIPTTASCEVCHVGAGSSITALPVGNGAKFSGSKMSHAGITKDCATCHVPAGTSVNFVGITRISGMPATSPPGAAAHIPSSTVCETCHLGSLPSGLVNASATRTPPGTAWATPAPTGVQIHTGITGGCSSCHDTGMVWVGVGAYPISPSTLTPGAQYKGFQTRPRAAAGSFNVVDPGHPATGDCSLCHTNTTAFVGVDKPSNHIPVAANSTCVNCHTSTDYAAMPTLLNIHTWAPSTTNNCAQCHGSAAASFAIPSANFSIVGLPGNHIPTTVSCEVCHVGTGSSITSLPVGNGAKFGGSKMNHAGITKDCATCHVTSSAVINFAGITTISRLPPTSPMGVSSHIPTTLACEVCHLAAMPTGLISANATRTPPGTAWATPAPTGVMIHTGITGSCNTCHDTSYVWMGMSAYPISPTTLTANAQYKGFQTRPRAAAGTFNVADPAHPATGDCSTCHVGTTYFDGATKPTGHIPTNAACTTCHVRAGDWTIAGLGTNAQIHAGMTGGCRSCHAGGPYAGSGTARGGSTLCATPALPYVPKPMPLSACGASPTTPNRLTHIPVGSQECSLCHGSANVTTFKMASTTAMKPKATTGPVPGTTMHQVGVPKPPFTCMSCHELNYTWAGVSIKTRDGTNHYKGQDCDGSGCHRNDGTGRGMEAQIRPIPVRRAAVNAALPRLLPRGLAIPGVAGSTKAGFDHRGVAAGQCASCHNGQMAKGRPARHFGPRMSCDACHRTSAWAPAQFTHAANIAGQCLACHNGIDAASKPGTHFVSSRSCDSCHTALAWQPVRYQHLSPSYQPMVDRPTCVSCHVTNGEVIPRQLHGNPRTRPVPVPPKSGP